MGAEKRAKCSSDTGRLKNEKDFETKKIKDIDNLNIILWYGNWSKFNF